MKTKKRKKVILIILAVLVLGAAAIAYFLPVGLIIHTLRAFSSGDNEVTEVRIDDTIHFVMNGSFMKFKAEVNGKPDTVVYDSGVSATMAMMFTPSTKPEGMKFYRHRVTGADKKSRIKSTTLAVTIGTDRVSNTGVGLAILNPEPPLCAKYSISDHHLLGSESLNIGHYKLDFTNREITFIPYSEPVDTAGFVPIKCAMRRNSLWVYPQINGVEYECIFDTGNGNAGFLLVDEQRIKNPQENDCVYEGSFGISIGGQASKQRFVRTPHETFGFGGVEKETEITYVKDLREFMGRVVMPASGDLPRLLLAHSMGGAVGALFLGTLPKYFSGAVLTSPMLKLHTGKMTPRRIEALRTYMKMTRSQKKLCFGQHHFDPEPEFPNSSTLSKARYMYFFRQRLFDSHYRTSAPSFGWVMAAVDVTGLIMKRAHRIKIPVTLMQSGIDTLVDAAGFSEFIKRVPQTRLIRYENAKHELFNAASKERKQYFADVIAEFDRMSGQ